MKRRIVLAVLCSAAVVASTHAEAPVSFSDAALKTVVEDVLWVSDPTPTDMLGLTFLNAGGRGIFRLAGLEHAVNLQTLYLRWNMISDISALSTLVNLQHLDIHDNRISDLSPLSGLNELRTLIIRFNRIRDISVLAGLTSLEHIDLRGNPLNDEAFETHIPAILANNPGIDLEYDLVSQRTLRISSTDGGSVIRPGEGTFVYDNGELVHLEAQADPGYVFLGWSGSFSTSTSSTLLWMDADHHVRAVFARVVDPDFAVEMVHFSDSALKAAVEEALGVSGPTPDDMRTLTELNCPESGISSLVGLEYASNLQELDISDNSIDDISLLWVLTSLQSLDLRGNPLNHQAYEVYLPLIISKNTGIDLNYDSPGQHFLSIHSTLGGSVVIPREGKLAYDDGEVVWLKAEAEPGFIFVGWFGSYESTANPTQLTILQNHNIEAVFAPIFDTLYVDANAVDGNGTIDRPFTAIQEAINLAADGDIIIVRPGTYRESISLMGKNIQLIGLDPNGAALPVIEGDGTGTIVSFVNGEDPNCLLMGFVITGRGDQTARAIACVQSSPTIANCLIVGNRITTPEGAAMRFEDSQAIVVNCTIADNHGNGQGGGLLLVDSQIVLANSIVWGNHPEGIAFVGTNTPWITYCNIQGGWPDVGNIDTDPLFARHGYWANPIDLEIAVKPDDPDALWVPGDYHLRSQAGRWNPQTGLWVQDKMTSPCIDAGDPTAPVEAEPLPNGNLVNMGTYGGTAQASKSKVGL